MFTGLNDFTKNILTTAAKEVPSMGNFKTAEGYDVPLYKGTLEQTKDGKRFTYIKVDDAFITKLSKVAQDRLNPNFKHVPYLSNGHDGKVGAHITLMDGGYPKQLNPEDCGKEVYFYLKPVNVWEWNQSGGSLLKGRILAAVADIVGGEGKKVIEKYGFSTPHSYHITFAMNPKN